MQIRQYIKQLTPTNIIFFFSLVAGWPCVFYLMGWLPHYQVNLLVLLGISALFAFSTISRCSLPSPVSIMIWVQLFLWVFYFLMYNDSSYITRICYLLITLFLLYIQRQKLDGKFLRIYDKWITLQAVLGVVGFILVLAGILQPLFTFDEMDHRPGYCFGLFTTNTYIPPIIRIAGFFDEPGAFAFWGIYALLLNKLFIKNNRIENLLLIGLIVTLSFAYFIQVALYIFFFMKKQRRKLLTTAFVVIACMKLVSLQSPEFDNLIFGRFEYNEETGTLNGDNRTDLMENTSAFFYEHPILGMGTENLMKTSGQKGIFVGANFFTFLAADGLVGFLCTWLPIFYLLSLGRKRKNFKYTAIILIVGLLQRPYDCCQLLYPLITFSMCFYAYYDTRGVKFQSQAFIEKPHPANEL